MSVEIRSAIDAAHRNIVHPFLTRGDAQLDREIAHERAIQYTERLQRIEPFVPLLRLAFAYKDPILRTQFGNENVGGLFLSNPLSLEAGFDKKALMYHFLGEVLGLGAIKPGTITKIPYDGNPRNLDNPRIVDLPESDSMWNSLGFPGDGSNEATKRFDKNKKKKRHYALIANVGASKPSFDEGTQIQDTIDVISQIVELVDGVEINESSPNTEGVRDLQKPENFRELASQARQAAFRRDGTRIAVIHKLSPNISPKDLEEDIEIAIDYGATGITIGNTTTDQDIRDRILPVRLRTRGGISGQEVRKQAIETTHIARDYAGQELGIWFVGGLETGEHAWEAATYGGADAFGFLTGFVKKNSSTPNFAYYLLRDLARAMRANGMTSMADFRELRGKRVPFPRI